MNEFESKLRSMKLREPTSSLDDRVAILFEESRRARSASFSLFAWKALSLAAAAAVTAAVIWTLLNGNPAPPSPSGDIHKSITHASGRRKTVLAMNGDFASMFDFSSDRGKSFFLTEKNELRQLTFAAKTPYSTTNKQEKR